MVRFLRPLELHSSFEPYKRLVGVLLHSCVPCAGVLGPALVVGVARTNHYLNLSEPVGYFRLQAGSPGPPEGLARIMVAEDTGGLLLGVSLAMGGVLARDRALQSQVAAIEGWWPEIVGARWEGWEAAANHGSPRLSHDIMGASAGGRGGMWEPAGVAGGRSGGSAEREVTYSMSGEGGEAAEEADAARDATLFLQTYVDHLGALNTFG